MNNRIIITKNSSKGEDGHKTFSVRSTNDLVARLDKVVNLTNRTRNSLVNQFIEYGLDHLEIRDK